MDSEPGMLQLSLDVLIIILLIATYHFFLFHGEVISVKNLDYNLVNLCYFILNVLIVFYIYT